MAVKRIPCIGGPIHGQERPMLGCCYIHRTLGLHTGLKEHRYELEHYANSNRGCYFWVHPDATDAQIDHALGLADI